MQQRAIKLLRMAEGMDERVEFREYLLELRCNTSDRQDIFRLMNELDTCKRASRRLWSAYINELTKIKLDI
jgi:hypothetical protein